MEAVGDTITSDIPAYRLPDLAAIMDEMAPKAVTRAVVNHPLVDIEGDALRVVARARPQGDPGDGRGALLDAGDQADAVADAEADSRSPTAPPASTAAPVATPP